MENVTLHIVTLTETVATFPSRARDPSSSCRPSATSSSVLALPGTTLHHYWKPLRFSPFHLPSGFAFCPSSAQAPIWYRSTRLPVLSSVGWRPERQVTACRCCFRRPSSEGLTKRSLPWLSLRVAAVKSSSRAGVLMRSRSALVRSKLACGLRTDLKERICTYIAACFDRSGPPLLDLIYPCLDSTLVRTADTNSVLFHRRD